ncbi:unnamed protein product [Ectocarpus sp. CCAP 1310/34]|nr:unnamed protein product [Ectocarpus sp. CCAP 1310/34]
MDDLRRAAAAGGGDGSGEDDDGCAVPMHRLHSLPVEEEAVTGGQQEGQGHSHPEQHGSDDEYSGDTVNVNTGEALHKLLKSFAKSSKGTDNTLLIARELNTRMAATAMMEGMEWSARRYSRKQRTWLTERIKASPACRKLMRTLLDSSKVSRKHGVSRVRRTVEWKMDITNKGKSITAAPDNDIRWIEAIAKASKGFDPDALYRRWYSCGRPHGEEARCSGLRCIRCWKFRVNGFRHTEARCFNNWTGAPARASGGTGTVRGCPVEMAEPNNRRWMFAPYPCGTDVEIFFTPDALAAQRPGPAGTCTLGKVAYFIEHVGNPPQGEDTRGEPTVWVAVAEYVSAAVGQSTMRDAATGHPVMRLRDTLSFFPAEAIRRVVQVYHACAYSGGCKAVSENNKAPVWKHKLSPGDNFLYNEHFHSVL